MQPGDTVVVSWLERFGRSFDDGVEVQEKLTEQNISIVASKDGINTADDSAAAVLFRRIMLTGGLTRWSPPANG